MYFGIPTTQAYIRGVKDLDAHASAHDIDIFIIPDFINILSAAETLKESSVMLGAQDAFWEDTGAYTGEISPSVLKQAGCKIVEMGHAERRRMFSETDEQVALKARAAARNGLIPLVCIGEKAQSSVASEAVGLALRECVQQVTSVLAAVPDDADVILAYEPVWAIGKSEPASADHVVAVTQQLRSLTTSRKGRTRILYGGSAGPGTFQTLKEGVDGLFLGRFGHDINAFKDVITELGQA